MHLVIFEGGKWDGFAPVALGRPTFMLQCGMGTLLDRHLRLIAPTRVTFWVRPSLVEYCKQRVLPKMKIPAGVNQPLDDEAALIIGGRTLHFQKYETPDLNTVSVEHDQFVREAYIQRPGLSPQDALQRTPAWTALMDLPRTTPQARWANHLWDLVHWNEESLVNDAITSSDEFNKLPAGAYHIVGDEVMVGANVKIGAGAVLDSSRGPVVVATGVEIGACCVLTGPCYVGSYTRLAPFTGIGAGTSIGSQCYIGGNIDNSIICDYVDKPHEGFIGHSYVGDWCNIGAGTMTANVKATYGDISILRGSSATKSGRWSLGTVIGDHSKTSIGTRLPPGCYIGYCCMLTGSGLAPKYIPSFSYWTDAGVQQLPMKKAVEVATRVFTRRNKTFTALDEQLLQHAAESAPLAEK
ncbi:MAG TPA: putative sugar nucleotidyl transferase [Tepidisphaeraceae bacterium]|nr:putative sugar nucleotidyl transferase [Tepidisphaeraceae bacterium]